MGDAPVIDAPSTIAALTQQWFDLLSQQKDPEALRLYCETIIPHVLPDLKRTFRDRYKQDGTYDGLISLLGFTPDTVVLAYRFATPKTLVVLHSEATNKFLDDVVDYSGIAASAFFHEPFDEHSSVDIFHALERALKRFPKTAKIAIELTGGKKIMGGALAVAAGILNIDLLYIDYTQYNSTYRKPPPASTYIHLVENPVKTSLELFGTPELDKAIQIFNTGRFDVSETLFTGLAGRIGNPRAVEACQQLSKFYNEWNQFAFGGAAGTGSALEKHLQTFHEQIASMVEIPLEAIRAQIKTVKSLSAGDRFDLMYHFYFSAERYFHNGQQDIAALLYYRTMEATLDNALRDKHEDFQRDAPRYELFGLPTAELLEKYNRAHRVALKNTPVAQELPRQVAMLDAACFMSDHLRAYPNRPVTLKAMMPKARCNIAM
jgi:Csm6 6H domain